MIEIRSLVFLLNGSVGGLRIFGKKCWIFKMLYLATKFDDFIQKIDSLAPQLKCSKWCTFLKFSAIFSFSSEHVHWKSGWHHFAWIIGRYWMRPEESVLYVSNWVAKPMGMHKSHYEKSIIFRSPLCGNKVLLRPTYFRKYNWKATECCFSKILSECDGMLFFENTK